MSQLAIGSIAWYDLTVVYRKNPCLPLDTTVQLPLPTAFVVDAVEVPDNTYALPDSAAEIWIVDDTLSRAKEYDIKYASHQK